MNLSGAHDRPTLLRALPLNCAFGVYWGVPGQNFTGADVLLVLTNIDAGTPSATRKLITTYTLSVSNSQINIAKDAAWVAANLTAGTYEGILTVNEGHAVTFRFPVLTPTGGVVSP